MSELDVSGLVGAIGKMIEFVAGQLGESTEVVRKRVLAELAKPDDDETEPVLADINADLPSSDR
ncbi:MAG: hypothetical protein V3W44_10820 [Dehalococcoidales bacterium]